MNQLSSSIRKNPATWFYFGWLIINLIQAYGTELLHDEAYYWVYSRYPAWGYFDHPPMIAILIKLGYSIFPNELGVRLGIAFMNTATLWLVHQLLIKKDDLLFYAITASMGVLQIGGILAVPDLPLTFFTALFFWQYKRFLAKNNWIQAILLGAVMAGMLYSKYHGILIILFTFLSNWRLIFNTRAWLAAIIGMLLFAPHLNWQYENGFPSVSYHLKERNAPAYQPGFTLEYIGGQLLLAGPLIGFLLLWAAWKFRVKDSLTRALKWTMWGFYGFFLISTFKGRVEANWTVPVLIPVIILSHSWLSDHISARKWIFKLLTPSLVLVAIVRLYMITDISMLTQRFKDEMHNNKKWAAEIKAHSNGLPVVFLNSYQRPSKYWFYSGDTSFAINTTYYRRNNYNFWPVEKEWQGREVLLVDGNLNSYENSFEIPTSRGATWARKEKNLQSHSHIRMSLRTDSLNIRNNQPIQLLIHIDRGSTTAFEELISKKPLNKLLVAEFFQGKTQAERIELTAEKISTDTYRLKSQTPVTAIPGRYVLKLGIATSLENQYSQNTAATAIEIN